MSYDGIPLAALDFYEDLENDNSKDFWTTHKHVYDEAVKAPMQALAAHLEPRFGAAKLFRPFRDVRFSKDKTPYKTHQGMWFGDSAVYVEVNAAGLRLAGGYWRTSTPQVQRLRRAVDDDIAGPLLVKAIAAVRRKGFEIGGEQLVRVPSGFDKEHERADLLRHKTLTAHVLLTAPEWLSTPQAATEISTRLAGIAPLVAWLDTHVGSD